MDDSSAWVQCPYCSEQIEFYVDPETVGTFVEDCEVCCRPWQVTVQRHHGTMSIQLVRAH